MKAHFQWVITIKNNKKGADYEMVQYKILTKYTSVLNKDFYQFYRPDDTTTEDFITEDLEELKSVVKQLDAEIGYENIKVVIDITYDVNPSINKLPQNVDFVEDDQLSDIYDIAYKKVFGEGDTN